MCPWQEAVPSTHGSVTPFFGPVGAAFLTGAIIVVVLWFLNVALRSGWTCYLVSKAFHQQCGKPSELSERLKRFMQLHGVRGEFVELLPEQAKTSQTAAAAVNCELKQIAKSIVVKGSKFYVIVLPGNRRVDLKKFSKVVNEPVRLATPEEVLSETGYRVGGVPPFGFRKQLKTFIDSSLLENEVVYASGGTDKSLLRIAVNELVRVLKNEIVDAAG